ncbi:MAG: DUF3857 domain-containing protein [Candidatus Omnitrophota bacterium]
MKRYIIFSLLPLAFSLLSGCTSVLNQNQLPGLYDDVSLSYLKQIDNNPGDKKLRLEAARFFYRFNDFERVKELLSGVKGKEENIILAKALFKLKDYDLALSVFEQLSEINDDEFMYFFARTLEEKSQFPRALKIYKKLKQPFKELGNKRIQGIGIKIEEGFPEEVRQLLNTHKDFISSIKDEEAVVLSVDEETVINEDNTSVATFYVAEKILNYKGKNLAEVEIGYDSSHERVELEFARTITGDSKVVYAGRENTRDVSKYLNFPLYSNARVYIISMPSVEVGSIIEYKVKVYSSKLLNERDLSFIYRLRERFPLARARLKLTVPQGRKINLKYINQEYAKGLNLTPAITEQNKTISYSWAFDGLDPIIPEKKMPPHWQVNPAIFISSFNSWDEIYNWWWKLFYDKIGLNNGIKDFVSGITKGCRGDIEKAKKNI